MKPGAYTAIITPFKNNTLTVDETGLEKLVDFQIENGISGILAVGTTGESPTLAWEEHNRVTEIVIDRINGRCLSIAGTGSNNTRECLSATAHAKEAGADAVLLVDPYYNGPSSLEIRREYVAPVAKQFPDLTIIPYVIPGRTGAQLLPEDLAILFKDYHNVNTVKEATGNLDNMKRTRACCGPEYVIFSGDDGITFNMMTDADIAAAGVISVITNVAPKAVVDMVNMLKQGDTEGARTLKEALDPLFGLVTVSTKETSPHGEVLCRARNPLAIKTLMTLLGMPSGGCRQPLGKMSKNGLNLVLETARKVQKNHPEILAPVADFFNVEVDERLNDPVNLEELCYDSY
jgi:4-hydroxy-tetrahydrodipicolinate synthase